MCGATFPHAMDLSGVVLNSAQQRVLGLIFLSVITSFCTHSACCVVVPPFQLSMFLSLCVCDLSSFLPSFFLFLSFLHKIFKRWSPNVYPQSHIFYYYNTENRVNKLTHTCDLPISFDRFAVFHQIAVLYSAATCWWLTLCMLISEPQVSIVCKMCGTVSVFKNSD